MRKVCLNVNGSFVTPIMNILTFLLVSCFKRLCHLLLPSPPLKYDTTNNGNFLKISFFDDRNWGFFYFVGIFDVCCTLCLLKIESQNCNEQKMLA